MIQKLIFVKVQIVENKCLVQPIKDIATSLGVVDSKPSFWLSVSKEGLQPF